VSAGLVGLAVGVDMDGWAALDVGMVLGVVLVGAAVFGAGWSGCGVVGEGCTRM
jgi:hypothetical protein